MALVDVLERVTDATAKEIVRSATTMDKAIGERPFGTKQLPERAQVRRYSMIRDDEAAWKKLLADHGPEPTIAYAKRMERLIEKYPEDDLSGTARLMRGSTAPLPEPEMGGSPAPTPAPAPVPMAAGGVVTKPTVALLGEYGPEAVVPLTPTDIRGGPDTGRPQPQMPPVTTESRYPYTWWLDKWGPPPRWLGDAVANYNRVQAETRRSLENIMIPPAMPLRETSEAEGRRAFQYNPYSTLTQPEHYVQPDRHFFDEGGNEYGGLPMGPQVPEPGPFPHGHEDERLPSGLTRGEDWLQAYYAWLHAQGYQAT